MQELRLQRLTLHNFKGARAVEFQPLGGDANIFGRNAAGKTTLFDAYCWLLWGKDSLGQAEFDVKGLTAEGIPESGIDHSVTGEFELDDRAIVLTRTYREKWVRARGAAKSEMQGHTTEYTVDGVPVTKGDYDKAVEGIAPAAIFRQLSDPLEVAQRMDWKERRQLVLEACGDVTDEEVLAADPRLEPLAAIIQTRSIEDHRKVVRARRTEINAELERLPVRIDEQTRARPEVDGDEEAARQGLESCRARITDLQTDLARVKAGGEVAELARQVAEVETEIVTARNAQGAAIAEALRLARKHASGAEADASAARIELDSARRSIASDQVARERLEKSVEERRAAFHAADAVPFEHHGPDTCAVCGQSLPAERVEAARAKALEQWNADKARKLEAIQAEGKALRAQLDELVARQEKRTGEIASFEQKVTTADAEVAARSSRVAALQAELDATKGDSAAVSELEQKKAELSARLASVRVDVASAATALQAQIDEVAKQVAALTSELAAHEQARRSDARVAELKAELQTLAAEFETSDRELWMLDEFTRTKVRMLEERINSRFQMARFRLFRQLVNGGLEECCEVTLNGVPWRSLNTGGQINVGLDIVNTLTGHYGVVLPVWCDHAESVTDLLPTRGQQIRLVVSADDAELRIETLSGLSAGAGQELAAAAH